MALDLLPDNHPDIDPASLFLPVQTQRRVLVVKACWRLHYPARRLSPGGGLQPLGRRVVGRVGEPFALREFAVRAPGLFPD